MRFHFFFLFLLWFARGYAQQAATIKFGTITPGEFDTKATPEDSTTEAILLYEKQTIYFTDIIGSTINSEYHARIKILKSSGSDRGNVSLVCHTNYKDREKIYDVEGFTYNIENGKMVAHELFPSAVFEEKISDWQYIKKILLPNVKAGSVIEYRYKRKTPFHVDNTPRTWNFQGDIPFKWSELSITIPASISYRLVFGGYLPLYINTKEKVLSEYDGLKGTNYRFVVKDAPAFKNEPYITCRQDYISKVEFGLVSYNTAGSTRFSHTWGDIVRYLNQHESFGEAIKRTGFLKETLNSFEAITDSTEKLNAIYSYMTTHFSWNEYTRLLAEDNLKRVFENKKGSSAELNLVLLMLLREAGFKANPVIMSTREHGEVKEEFPILDRLNYTLVQVNLNGKDILMDVTDPYQIPGLIPARCLSNKGYVMEKDTVRSISLRPAKSNLLVSINAELDATGLMNGTYSELSDSYIALSDRSYLRSKKEKDLMDLYKRIKPDWDIAHERIENKNDPFKSLQKEFDFSEAYPVNNDGKIYLNPMLTMETKENIFNEKERLYPVDIGNPYEFVVMNTIKIPEGYAIESLPRSLAITLPGKGGKYSYLIEVENNVIKLRSRLLLASSLYPAAQYNFLHEFYNTVIQKESEQVVLKKIQ